LESCYHSAVVDHHAAALDIALPANSFVAAVAI
jgi:hypothetical protein